MPGNKSDLLHLHSHPQYTLYTLTPETGPAQNRPSQTSALQEKHSSLQQKLVHPPGEQRSQCYSNSIKLKHIQELTHTEMPQAIATDCTRNLI